jgi:hypothetical protein
VDPISLLMAAQAAVAAVRKGTEMLSQGRAEISKLKKTVEQGIGDAKAIYSEVTGLWSWLKSLFGASKPAAKAAPAPEVKAEAKPLEKKADRKQREPELTYEEYQTQAIHQVCEQLKTFFEIRRKLKEHCLELEEISKTTTTVEDSALDRVEIELQLENMTVQIREAMVYAPSELRDIYSRFLKMYDQILEEQEFARQVKRKRERDEAWQRDLLRNHRIDRALALAVVAFVVVWMWGLMLSLAWHAKMPDGLQPL